MPETSIEKKTELKPKRGRPVGSRSKSVVTQAGAQAPRGKSDRYFEGIGRRKTASARVRLYTRGDRNFVVNGRDVNSYFPVSYLSESARAALTRMNVQEKFRIVVKVNGGGMNSQAEAIRLGSARALLKFNPEFRKRLKKAGFLTRDSRKVERKKPGLKKARRAPQWRKR